MKNTELRAEADPYKRIGVVGGGTMGSGIAHAFLVSDSRVVVVEADVKCVAKTRDRIANSLRRTEQHDSSISADLLLERLAVVTDPMLLGSSTLLIEAVPEEVALKRTVLARVEGLISQGTLLATNTSSIAIGELAGALQHPERFLGMHFFNPVAASALVEVVIGPQTQTSFLEQAKEWVDALSKESVVVRDSPGFATSRLGLCLGLEAIRMVEDNVASPADIDRAMTLGYKHPVGPLRLTDLIGLDVRLHISQYLSSTLGDRFAPPQLLRTMVAEGKLGQKSGVGFYEYPSQSESDHRV